MCIYKLSPLPRGLAIESISSKNRMQSAAPRAWEQYRLYIYKNPCL